VGIAVVENPDQPKARKDDSRLWWLAPKLEANDGQGIAPVANRLQNWCDGIERVMWPQRWANLTYYRYMTGREAGPTSYNYSSTSRPSALTAYWSRARFAAPRDNVLAQCSDALHARVYSHRPFLFVSPIDGDNKARSKSKKLTHFLDASFFDLKLWPQIEQCGADCRMWGAAFLKVDVDVAKKKIEVVRVIADEVVADDNELNAGAAPMHLGIRLFVNRDVMIDKYKGNEAAIEAIMRAPKSSNGCYFGSEIDATDVIVLREAWSLPVGDSPGRHVLSVGGYAFVDEEYHRNHFPIARLVFNDMSTGWFGQGMPEMVIGLMRELDFEYAAVSENMRRAAWPRIGIKRGSNVNPSSLADTSNGVYYWSDEPPRFDFPQPSRPEQFQWIGALRNAIKERFRLNDQVANGQKPKLTSGIAIEKEDEVNDQAHVDLMQHLEDFIEQIGILIIEAAEVCQPTVRLPGRTTQEIKWSDVKIAESSYSLRVFKICQLSQSAAAKQQQIDTWFAEGSITRAIKMRLEQVPDVDGYQNLANSGLDFIELVLDCIVFEGEYHPPEPWLDLQAASENAQSRYLLEKARNLQSAPGDRTPEKHIDMLLQWMSQVQELIDDAMPPASAGPAPGGFGIQPPVAPPPGAPQAPFPIAPNAAPPAPPPAQ
jgi:hypothetical protein